MALADAYMVGSGRIPDLFAKIRDGQAPEQFSIQLLKDWGFTSSNDRGFLPLLKALGFLSPDGKPTTIYREYRDHSRSSAVMAQAIRNAYSDIFLIKEHPTESDRTIITGKFKSYHNASDNTASLMAKTFLTLLKLADLSAAKPAPKKTVEENDDGLKGPPHSKIENPPMEGMGLHYNIQIHLPATKDIEVYNSIFKALKEHIVVK
jgi:hypothetical protein